MAVSQTQVKLVIVQDINVREDAHNGRNNGGQEAKDMQFVKLI